MLKSIALKRMSIEAESFINFNRNVLEKYNATIKVDAKSNHTSVRFIGDVEHIIPFGILCTYRTDENGVRRFTSVSNIRLCMNSVYLIAKARNEKPMVLLHQVLDSLFNGLKSGVYHREISTPNPKPFEEKKEAVLQ